MPIIMNYRQTSPVGASPTTSSFSASMDWAKTTARRDDKHLSLGIQSAFYLRFDPAPFFQLSLFSHTVCIPQNSLWLVCNCGRCVIPSTCCRTVWWMSHGRMVNMLATAVCNERCLWDSEVISSKPRSGPWSNSLIIGFYPPTKTRWHAFMSTPFIILPPNIKFLW